MCYSQELRRAAQLLHSTASDYLTPREWGTLHALRTAEIRRGDRVRLTEEKIAKVRMAMAQGYYTEENLESVFDQVGVLLRKWDHPPGTCPTVEVLFPCGKVVADSLAYFTRETVE